MLRPIWRIVVVALAAPALLVTTAMVADASEYHAAGTYYDSTGAAANALGAWTLHLSAGNEWHGRDLVTWYQSRTADADALGAHTSTADAAAYVSDHQGRHVRREWRDYSQQSVGRSDQQPSRAWDTAELTAHHNRTHVTEAAYHQSGAQADARGASTSTTTAAVSDYAQQSVGRSDQQPSRTWDTAELTAHHNSTHVTEAAYHQSGAQADAQGASTSATTAAVGNNGDYSYAWDDQSMANASALGADAGHTAGYATNDNWSHDGWRHDDCDHGQAGENNWNDRGAVGYTSSLAHAGYDGAWAGDTDSAAVYGY